MSYLLCVVDTGVHGRDLGLCVCSSADPFGLFPLSSAGSGSPGCERTAELRVPSELYSLLPNQGV